MVGLTRIMDQLVEKGYHDLTSAEQAQLAQAVAGRDHYTRFIKLMENHDRVTQLTTVAIERQSSATSELEHFTGNATFAQNQLTAAMETTSAEIGQVLLPAITSAEAVSYGLNAGFLSILETNEELTGVMGGLDKSFAFLGTGISNVGIMRTPCMVSQAVCSRRSSTFSRSSSRCVCISQSSDSRPTWRT